MCENAKKKYVEEKYIFLILLAVNIFWFAPVIRKSFITGDCIRLLNQFKYSDNPLRLVFFFDGAFRPVFYGIILLLIRIIGYNYTSYLYFNVLLNTVIAYYVYLVVKKHVNTKKSVFLPLMASMIYIVSIYSYYGLTQICGILEQMCVLFCIALFDELLLYIEKNEEKHFRRSILFSALAMYTHERFIVLFGVYFVFICFFMYGRDLKKKIESILLASIPLDIFLFAKLCILHTPIFRGTGQTTITIQPQQVLKFIATSIASIFGFNHGASYLFGYGYTDYTILWKVLTEITFLMAVSVFCIYFYQRIIQDKMRWKEIQKLVVFILIEGGCILCYCISIRIEMRQLYVPFVILLVYSMYCFDNIELNLNFKKVFIAITSITILGTTFQFQEHVDNLFFLRAGRYSKSVYEQTIPLGKDKLGQYKLYFYNQADLTWGTLVTEEKSIFDLYWNSPQIEYEVWDNYDAIYEEINNNLSIGKKAMIFYPKNDSDVGQYLVEKQEDLVGMDEIIPYMTQ